MKCWYALPAVVAAAICGSGCQSNRPAPAAALVSARPTEPPVRVVLQEQPKPARRAETAGMDLVALSAPETFSPQDVVHWTRSGESDFEIVRRIEEGATVFRLNAADENRLRDQGVSERVIESMKATARR